MTKPAKTKKLISLHGKGSFDKKYFGGVLKKYDQDELNKLMNLFEGLYRFISRYVNLGNKNKRVLEIGCHIGAFTGVLKKKGYNVTSSDISKFIIQKAKQLQKEIDFRVINIEDPILIEGKFDYIYAIGVVEHLVNPEKAFRNIKKKLKPGGYFIFLTCYLSKQSLSEPEHINVHDHKWWIKLGKKTGFKELKYNHTFWLPYIYKFGRWFSIWLPIRFESPFLGISSSYMFYFKG